MYKKVLTRAAFTLAMVCICNIIAYANEYGNYYSYKSVCPIGSDGKNPGGNLTSIGYASTFQKPKPDDPSTWYWSDMWGFAQCNCTSYASYEQVRSGVDKFDNTYLQPKDSKWGDGKHWGDAAGNVVTNSKIVVDDFPIPGDVVYWEKMSSYGHVGSVKKVEYDSNMNWKRAYITQYNGEDQNGKYLAYDYSERWITPADKPSGFIHILAFHEGVTSLHYLDCSEMGTLCDNQTPEEWQMIANMVWNYYRCKGSDCNSKYDLAYINSIAGGFGGGSTPNPNPTPAPIPTDSPAQIGIIGGRIAGISDYKHELTIYANQPTYIEIETQAKNETNVDIKADFYYYGDGDKNFKFDSSHEIPGRDTGVTIKANSETEKHSDPICITATQTGTMYFYSKLVSNGLTDYSHSDNSEQYFKVTVVAAPRVDLAIYAASLVDGLTAITLNGTFRISVGVINFGPDMLATDTNVIYYIKEPGATSFSYLEEDSIGASDLTPGRVQWESTPTSGYVAKKVGTYQVKVVVDANQLIPETNESNNSYTFTFEVIAEYPPITGDLLEAVLAIIYSDEK